MGKNAFVEQMKDFFRGKTLLSTIIAVNVVIALFTLLFGVIDYLFALGKGATSHVWMDWFALSSDPRDLLYRPWTLVSYMFLHNGLGHLLFNMLMLYFGGIMCYRYMGMKRFGWTYFMSGIAGALFYLLCYNLFPVFVGVRAVAVGASAGVLGVFVAVATYMPDQEVGLWPIPDRFHTKIKYVAIALVAIDLLCVPKGNAGGHFAHLGGMLYGFLSVWLLRQKGVTAFFHRFSKQERRQRKELRSRKKMKAKKSSSTTQGRPLSDDEYNRRKVEKQKEVDAILDKISKSGYESLSKEEKAKLFNQ